MQGLRVGCILLGALSCLIARAAVAPDEIVCKGVQISGTTTQVSLSDAAGNSRWVEVGRNFAGFRVESYETDAQTVVLVKDGLTKRVRVNDAKVQHAAPPKPGAESLATRRAFWEKIKTLEGQALLNELMSEKDPKYATTTSALRFLMERNNELAEQANAAKRKLDEFIAKASESERATAEAKILALDFADQSRAVSAVSARLHQAAAAQKETIRKSLEE